jgi:hypothetical protein
MAPAYMVIFYFVAVNTDAIATVWLYNIRINQWTFDIRNKNSVAEEIRVVPQASINFASE